MKSPCPVIAAVPTYNMAEQVTTLIPQLLEQRYDRVFILDDASTDDTVQTIQEQFADEVTVVSGNQNVGSGANRNRIIPALKEVGMSSDTIINFVDADMTLVAESEQVPDTARELLARHTTAGIVGGLILNEGNTWSAFNYGPLLPKFLPTSLLQLRVDGLSRTDPQAAHEFYARFPKLLGDWPDPTQEPETKSVGWTLEGFSMIRAATFDAFNGYDPKLQYCETLDLSRRMQDKGLERIFDPTVGAIHHEVNVRGAKRAIQVPAAHVRLMGREVLQRFSRSS